MDKNLFNLNLALLNMSDARKGGGKKWMILAKLMDMHRLHGIALQETRIKDATTFQLYREHYPNLTLMYEPCMEGTEGGFAGGLAFLVRTSLVNQGMFGDLKKIQTSGYYGKEYCLSLQVKTTTYTFQWVNCYIRGSANVAGKSYEWDKLKVPDQVKGNVLLMGDLNGSPMYSQPISEWLGRGLGNLDGDAGQHKLMHKIGSELKKMLCTHDLVDISSKGEYTRRPTRVHVNGTANKLDLIAGTESMIKGTRAKITGFVSPTADVGDGDWAISDHMMIVCNLKTKFTVTTGRKHTAVKYKLQSLLDGHSKQREYETGTSSLASELTGVMNSMSLLEFNSALVTKLHSLSSEVAHEVLTKW